MWAPSLSATNVKNRHIPSTIFLSHVLYAKHHDVKIRPEPSFLVTTLHSSIARFELFTRLFAISLNGYNSRPKKIIIKEKERADTLTRTHIRNCSHLCLKVRGVPLWLRKIYIVLVGRALRSDFVILQLFQHVPKVKFMEALCNVDCFHSMVMMMMILVSLRWAQTIRCHVK